MKAQEASDLLKYAKLSEKAVAKFDDSHSELCNKEYIILKTDGTKILGRTNSIGNIEEYDLGFGSYFIGMKWEKNENE